MSKQPMNIFIFLGLLVLPLILYVTNTKGVEKKLSIEECIYSDSPKLIELESLSNKFIVEYIQNSPSKCINPSFPSIKISSFDKDVIGWVHLVYTDSTNLEYKNFVDSQANIFPFYTRGKEFLDAPLWSFTLLRKPLTYWRGHAYAFTKIDNKIKLLGGIKWGFDLGFLSLKPEAIVPELLTLEDWVEDVNILRGGQDFKYESLQKFLDSCPCVNGINKKT